jgi:hypothetical protein
MISAEHPVNRFRLQVLDLGGRWQCLALPPGEARDNPLRNLTIDDIE